MLVSSKPHALGEIQEIWILAGLYLNSTESNSFVRGANNVHSRKLCKNDLNTVQVNICQKHLFLHQLTHNMTTGCSLNYEFST